MSKTKVEKSNPSTIKDTDLEVRLKSLIKKLPDVKLDMQDVQSLALSVFYDIAQEDSPSANLKRIQVESLRLLSDTLKEEEKAKKKNDDNSMSDEALLFLLKKK